MPSKLNQSVALPFRARTQRERRLAAIFSFALVATGCDTLVIGEDQELDVQGAVDARGEATDVELDLSDAGIANDVAQDSGRDDASDATLSDATPDDAAPSDAAPSDATRNDTTPSDATPSDVALDGRGDSALDSGTADTTPDAGADTAADAGGCPLGTSCNPIPVSEFPFVDERDTRDGPQDAWDYYACAPDTDESGPEWVYRVVLTERGRLSVSVSELSAGADPDLHLLSSADPDACLERGHREVSATLAAGSYFVVVDTWVNAAGVELGGRYAVDFAFAPATSGNCAMEERDLRMFWSSCAASLDCYESGGQRYLRTPATGPVALEAHLVTVAESFSGGWPSSARQGIAEHYALSQAATSYAMGRREPWAPAGEGGSRWGQGSTGAPLPVLDEAWYVNMYWRDRPAPGTRILVTNPANGRTVVASGGYETGPGANTAIGGAVEEIHHYLGTSHLGSLTFGFAADQSLPLGPIECD